tara:strand:+ start:12878 stop:13030 length:153 start_codon:yes stop_codon:yes gene_type:complete
MSKEKKNNTVTKVISSNDKMKMVVVQTTVPNKKNRKGQPFRTSVTKHIKK